MFVNIEKQNVSKGNEMVYKELVHYKIKIYFRQSLLFTIRFLNFESKLNSIKASPQFTIFDGTSV